MEGTQDTRVDDRYRPITLHHLSDSGNLIFIIFMKVGGVISGSIQWESYIKHRYMIVIYQSKKGIYKLYVQLSNTIDTRVKEYVLYIYN